MTTPHTNKRAARPSHDVTVPKSTREKPAASKVPPMLERAFQRQVIELARRCGWRVHHTYGQGSVPGSRAIDRGFPDLVLMRAPQLLVVELKTDRGRVSQEQDAWLSGIEQCGVPALVWRPADWPDIEAILTATPKAARKGRAPHEKSP